MKSTITDLWRGNIAPVKECGAYDQEARQTLQFMEKNREELCQGLTAEQAEVFHRYMSCSEDYLLRMVEIAFCDGFCLGSRLTAETLI